MDSEKIVVSICCVTYNHDKFIAKALDGFIMQKTNFKYELLIHDDASTDNTQQIIKEYEAKYPEIIKPIYQVENQKSIMKRGVNIKFNYSRAKGKYIALCEGDDYWTDPYKLQTQVDFLEANEEYTISFHNTQILKNNSELTNVKMLVSMPISMSDLLDRNFIHTSSVVFKHNIIDFNDEIFKQSPFGDYPLFIMLLKKGKIHFINEYMSVYRLHEGGVWTKLSKVENINKKINFYTVIKDSFSEEKYRIQIKNKIINLVHKKIELEMKETKELTELNIAAQSIRYITTKRLVKELFLRLKKKIR